jgi:hypothetical protein
VKNHDSCKPPAEFQKPPKRLINVGNEAQNPFLVETFPDSQRVEWLALSYCWGDKPRMELTQDTIDMLRNGISLIKFDPTIRDAILVTRALEITYVWIDALCINQDKAANEWNEQASKMNEIYGGSTVTLVVASSDSVMDGFLHERELSYIPISSSSNSARESSDSKSPAKVFISPEWDKNKDKLKGPWSKRGWTMQEGLIPSRLLHYTSSQMIWKCGEERRFERGVTESLNNEVAKVLTYLDDVGFGSGWFWKLETFMKFKRFPNYLPSNLDYPLLSVPETFHLWYDLIEEYTQRKFTHISDRLVAISGLAQIFGNMIRSIRSHDEYVAGLWKPDLIRGLIWHTKGAKLLPQKAVNNDFPSWSWASAGYELVENGQKNNDSFQTLSQIEGVQIDLVDQRLPFGAVNGGRVTITGPLKKIPRLYNKEWKSVETPMSEFERHVSEIVEEKRRGGVERRYASPPGGHFAALQMLEAVDSLDLLMLEATGKVLNGINMYRRVGVLTLWHFPKEMVASPEVIAMFKRLGTSRTARLGPQEKNMKTRTASNKVVMELETDQWQKETVVIV